MTTPEQVEFRPAVIDDLPAIISLLADDQFGKGRNPQFELARETYEAAFNDMRRSSGDNGFIVAVSSEGIVGCYQLTFIRGLSHKGALRVQIESVRIASALRGSGLGSRMMRDAIERARTRGAFQVQLTTDIRREHTRRFYERLGFTASHHGMKLVLS